MNPEDLNNFPVGVGLAVSDMAIYIPFITTTRKPNGTVDTVRFHWDTFKALLEWIEQYNLLAHNMLFEDSWFYRYTKRHVKSRMCTFGMFMQLANEKFFMQRWGLKDAQENILGWRDRGDVELDAWLTSHGLKKADMWQAPVEILGKYCCDDAVSTYHLFEYFSQVLEQYPNVKVFHELFLNEMELLVEQQARGLNIDVQKLDEWYKHVLDKVDTLQTEFLTDQEVVDHIKEWNRLVLEDFMQKEPPKFNKEPVKLTKTGKISKGWERWNEAGPSKRWKAWNEKLEAVKTGQHFNTNSKDQLRWLFFERLGYKTNMLTPAGKEMRHSGGEITPAHWAVSKETLPTFGQAGRVLVRYNAWVKYRGYTQAAKERTRGGILHAKYKWPGTVTRRPAGSSGFNMLQQPKLEEYFKCFIPKPGNVLVGSDFSSVEPRVLAYLSQDPNYYKLYGPDAKPNDAYLFAGAGMEKFKAQITKHYDPYNPTPESIKTAKKECKSIRDACKRLVLAMNYAGRPGVLLHILTVNGFDFTFPEVQGMFNDYWDLFSGIKKYEHSLRAEWFKNNGVVMNGAGLPMAVPEKYMKDLINRVVQSTAHCLLEVWLDTINRKRKEYGVPMVPYIVDFYDEVIWETPKGTEEDAIKIIREGLDELNETLNWDIKIDGDPIVGNCLADIKLD